MYPDKLFETTLFGLLKNPIGPNLYGIMIAIGLVLCVFVFLPWLAKVVGINKKSVDFFQTAGLIAIAIGFVTAMIFQWFYNLIDKGIEYANSNFGAVTFIGGLIGGVLSFLGYYAIFGKKYPSVKKDFFKLLQVAFPCILIAHAFGRVGCFFAGCCGGVETDSWIGIMFPDHAHKVIPTQLIEAIFLFILCGISVLLCYKKWAFNPVLYLFGYGIFRFTIEFFRGDERGGLIPGISPSQFWSLMMWVIAALILAAQMIYIYKRQIIPKKLLPLAKGLSDPYAAEIEEEENDGKPVATDTPAQA